jgi:hypothetical protein
MGNLYYRQKESIDEKVSDYGNSASATNYHTGIYEYPTNLIVNNDGSVHF